MAGAFSLGTAPIAIVLHVWPAATALGIACLSGLALGAPLTRRADSGELAARAERNEKWVDARGRATGRASGGWKPRLPERDDALRARAPDLPLDR